MKTHGLKTLLGFLIILFFSSSYSAFAQTDFLFNLLWEENIFPNNPYNVEFDQLDRPYFYVSNDNGGVRIYLHENNADPVMIDQIATSNWEDLKVMDLTQNGNYLYLALGSFFDGNQLDFGMAIINIENPEAAFFTDYWISDEPKKGAAAIRVAGDYAFLGAMNSGLYILDVSDPNQISEVSNYLPDPDFPVPNPGSAQEPNARGLAIKDDVVFLCYDAGGLSAIDISQIEAPDEISRYINTDILGQTQQAFNHVLLQGNTAYIATDYCGLEIVDITDPMVMTQLGSWNPWGCETIDNNWLNSMGHANQLAFIPGQEGNILIINANDTELLALDVSDPANVEIIASYGEVGDSKRTWGLGVNEDYIIGAYYFTLIPWTSSEARLKLFSYDFTAATQDKILQEFTISPNPSNGWLELHIHQPTSAIVNVSLLNIVGQNLSQFEGNIIDGKLDLNFSEHSLNGLYFLELELDGESVVKPLVFQN